MESSHEHDLFLTFWSDCHFVWNPDKNHWDLGDKNPFIPEKLQERKFNKYRDLLGL